MAQAFASSSIILRMRDLARPQAAILLRERHRQDVLLGEQLLHIPGKLAFRVYLRGARRDLLARQIAHHVDHHLFFVANLYGHLEDSLLGLNASSRSSFSLASRPGDVAEAPLELLELYEGCIRPSILRAWNSFLCALP